MEGGAAENAIPTSCRVVFQSDEPFKNLSRWIQKKQKIWRRLYQEPLLEIQLTNKDFTADNLYEFPTLLNGLLLLHQGVLSHDPYISDAMLASTNVGLITKDGLVTLLSRSLTKQAMLPYYERLTVISKMCEVELSPFHYDIGWCSLPTSHLRKIALHSHEKIFHTEAKCFTVHAGLETSLLSKKYPKWDMISMGPTIERAHTIEETLHIDTIEPFALWVQEIILQLQQTLK
jgi:dipeptidase D